MSLQRSGFSSTWLAVGFAEVLTLASPLLGCNDPASYARVGVDLSVAGLDAKKRALVKHITIRSHAEGSTDPQATYEVQLTPADLDKSFAYHFDYVPYPQKGAFVVTATLVGDANEQLAIRSERVVVKPGKTVRAKIDFVSEVTAAGPCTPEADPVEISDTEGGSKTFTFLWDTDHYLYVYGDLTHGKGDLVSLKLDAHGNRLSQPVAINSSARISSLPSLAKVGTGYALAWQEGNFADIPVTIQLRHLDENGAPVGNIREIPTNADEARPQILPAFDKIAMTWIDHRGPTSDREHLALVAFLDPVDFAFRVGQPATLALPGSSKIEDAFPGIALIGNTLSASWVANDQTVLSSTVGADLAIGPPTQLYTSEFTAQQLWMVPAGNRFFTVWEDLSGDQETGRERIRGAYTALDTSLGATDLITEPLSGSANWPRAAYDGHGSVAVVYYQYRDFGSQIYLQRFSTEGDKLDLPPVQITDVLGQAKYPNIQLTSSDATGDHFAIGWVSDHTGIQRVYFQAFACQ